MGTPVHRARPPRLRVLLLLSALVLALSGPLAAALASSPVVLGDDTLFPIQARVASFDPSFRAEVISRRILTFARDLDTPLEAIKVADNPVVGSTDIRAGETTLVTLLDADAAAAGTARDELATVYAQRIRAAVQSYRSTYGWRSLLIGAASTVVLTMAFLAGWVAISRSFPRIRILLRSWQGTRIPGLKLFHTQILSAGRVVDLLTEIVRIIRLVLYLLLIAAYGSLVLSFFPWTRGLTRSLFGYVKAALATVIRGVVDYLPNLVFLAVIGVITYYLLKILRFIFTEVERGTIVIDWFYPEWAKPTHKLIQFLVLAFAATVSFPYFPGSHTPAFQGISIFLGVLISLGSSSAIANIFAGIILTYTRGFLVGHRVQIGDTVGDVVDKTLLVTRIRTIKNVVVTIPNSSVLTSHIVNYSSAATEADAVPLILHSTITLGYDIPWRQAYEVLIAAALRTPGVLAEPAPFVLQSGLDDFYVRYELNAYTADPGVMARIYSSLHENIQDGCNAAGLEIMSPHYRALRDGSELTLPASCRPPGA
ncbi:MAG: mechanosensitive ion channel family protein [Cyanobacteria bacterium J06638_7]